MQLLPSKRTPRKGAGLLPAAKQRNLIAPSVGEKVRHMFPKLTDTRKATIFTVLVLLMALGGALLFKVLGLTSKGPAAGLYMFALALAALVMLLVVTRDGFSKEGWKTLGLHRLGLSVWWIAIGVTLLTSLAASSPPSSSSS